MRSINIFFDNETHEAVASIDGWETFMITPQDEDKGFSGKYEIKVKSDARNEWHTPEDDGPHVFDKYADACDAIMEYIRNEISITNFDLQGL